MPAMWVKIAKSLCSELASNGFVAVNKSESHDSSLIFRRALHRPIFMASNLITRNPLEHLPTTGIVAVTQTAVGCGLGLLLASKLQRSTQKITALAMLSLGVASLVPVAIGVVTKYLNQPLSARGLRKRLESIREDSGLSEDMDVY